MSPRESAKTERNVKQKITATDVTTEDSHIQSSDEKGVSYHTSDQRLSGQFVAINPQYCRCVCQGWAEILILRPSRNISWIMRIQNRATSWLESDVSTALTDDPQIDECKFDTHLPLRALFFLFHVQ